MSIKQEYEQGLGEYIEYGRAVSMLASFERVGFSYAASWLIDKHAHLKIPCYVRLHPRAILLDPAKYTPGDKGEREKFVPHTPKKDVDSPFSNGPLDILDVVKKCDNLWWDYVGLSQRDTDENQRWKRDEFWQFVIDEGADINADQFEDIADCPTFFRDKRLATYSAARQAAEFSYKPGSLAWRVRARAAEAELAKANGRSPNQTERLTLLDRLNDMGFSTDAIEKSLNESGSQYVARLILTSAEVARRSEMAWKFKSLADLAEEQFIVRSTGYWAHDSTSPRLDAINYKSWANGAMQELASDLGGYVWYEEEGLVFFVQSDKGDFRPAQAGDSPYDFVCRLRDEGLLGSTTLKIPGWAKELFVSKANYDAYSLVWFDSPGTNAPDYKAIRQGKRALVLHETARRTGVEPSSPSLAEATVSPYRDRTRILYTPELDAALSAWEAVTSNGISAPEGVAAKTALLEWLSKERPNLTRDARERIATVANWNKRGGATRTPESN